MAVGAGWGLNLPLPTPLIRHSSSATRPWDGVWTSRLLPEGEPIGLSKSLVLSWEKPVLSHHPLRAAITFGIALRTEYGHYQMAASWGFLEPCC